MLLSIFAGRTARRVAGLLRSEPQAWSLTPMGYRLEHTSGLSIWIGNGPVAVSLEHNGETSLWGISLWVFVFGSPNQQHVWRAVKSWKARRLTDLLDRVTGPGSNVVPMRGGIAQ